MDLKTKVSFDDIAVAFSAKSNAALRKANFLFSVVSQPAISKIATGSVKLALALHLPVKWVIKNTIFSLFCGGETIEDSQRTIANMGKFGLGTILDYSVEGEKTEEGFEHTKEELLRTVMQAKKNEHIPFCVFKVTGLGAFDLLAKVQRKDQLDDEEQAAYARVRERVQLICQKAFDENTAILIDAEETWVQDTIDDLAYEMMGQFNKEEAIVFNTFQMYRVDMVQNLKNAFQNAARDGYYLGAKLVRGAYMEKERERAEEMNYPSPIQPDKATTDTDFDKGLKFCIDNKQRVSLVCGSHNEYSNYYLAMLMEKHNMHPNDARVCFAQLYGMSDNISYNLAKAGYNVAKYVPYGPVKSVMPYLLRRADENTSVAGQSSRELTLIRKELKRRRSA
jgi:proline dehydrogenase